MKEMLWKTHKNNKNNNNLKSMLWEPEKQEETDCFSPKSFLQNAQITKQKAIHFVAKRINSREKKVATRNTKN